MKPGCAVLASGLLLGIVPPQAAIAQESTSAAAIEPAAREVVRRACQNLQSLDRFSVGAEISYDEVLAAGYKLQYSRAGRLLVERPNRFRFESESDKGYRTFWYDGESLTIYDEDLNVYATFAAPDTIDATLDLIAERGIAIPLDDLLYSEPCAGLGEHVRSGYYVGLNYVEGGFYHQVLLATDAVDVQLWVEDDETPLIRKLVITYGEEPGEPQFIAVLRDWDTTPAPAPADFIFAPPVGAQKVDFFATGGTRQGEAP